MNETVVAMTLYLRLMLYPLAAYGFFLLATFRAVHEMRRADGAIRRLYYALSVFFLLLSWKAVTTFHHLNSIYVDLTLTPALGVIVILAYATMLYMARPVRNHNHG